MKISRSMYTTFLGPIEGGATSLTVFVGLAELQLFLGIPDLPLIVS